MTSTTPVFTRPISATERLYLATAPLAEPFAIQLVVVRGPAGRTRAIAAAIRIGIEQNLDVATVEGHIAAAEAAGRPLSLW